MPIQVFHMWWNTRGGTPNVGPPSDPVRGTLVTVSLVSGRLEQLKQLCDQSGSAA